MNKKSPTANNTPILLSGRFFDLLLAANRPQLAGFKHWLFHPGMLFQADEQWWGLEQSRPTPHEGLDLCWFADGSRNRQTLDPATVIPAPFAGTIVKLSRDFLGQSIFLAHELKPVAHHRLYTAFGHTAPREGLSVGQSVAAGEIIACIANPANRKTAVPPHLHLTVALIPDIVNPDQLNWDYLGTATTVTLMDPLGIFPTAWSMIGAV